MVDTPHTWGVSIFNPYLRYPPCMGGVYHTWRVSTIHGRYPPCLVDTPHVWGVSIFKIYLRYPPCMGGIYHTWGIPLLYGRYPPCMVHWARLNLVIWWAGDYIRLNFSIVFQLAISPCNNLPSICQPNVDLILLMIDFYYILTSIV